MLLLVLLVHTRCLKPSSAPALIPQAPQAQILSVNPNYVFSKKLTIVAIKFQNYLRAESKDGTDGALIGGATGAVAGGVIGNQIKQGGGGTAVGAIVGGLGVPELGVKCNDQISQSMLPKQAVMINAELLIKQLSINLVIKFSTFMKTRPPVSLLSLL